MGAKMKEDFIKTELVIISGRFGESLPAFTKMIAQRGSQAQYLK